VKKLEGKKQVSSAK